MRMTGCFAVSACLAALVGVTGLGHAAQRVSSPQVPGMLPRDVLEEFAGRTLPPLEELARSGRLGLAQAAIAQSSSPNEQGYVTEWLSHWTFLHGTLNTDLAGEAGLQPVCGNQPISSAENAPRLYRSYSSSGSIYSSSSNVPLDTATCSKDFTNLVKYFETQVWSNWDRDAVMYVGADGGIRVWLNGSEVLNQGGPADYTEDQYHVTVSLKKGWNFIVVKSYIPDITPPEGQTYLSKRWSLRFTAADGSTALNLDQAVDGWCSREDAPYGWVYTDSVAHIGGVGSTWRSDLRLTNPYVHPRRLTIEYTHEGGFSAAGISAQAADAPVAQTLAPDKTVTVTLAPYQTRIFRDVLPTLLGISGDEKGMIAIRGYYYWDAKNYDTVNLRTYNLSSAGTFGTTVPFYYLWDGYTGGTQAMLGLRNGPDFRTNLACVPTGEAGSSVDLTLKIWDPPSGTVHEKSFTGHGYFQINDIFKKLGAESLVTSVAIAYVSWSSQPGNPRWACSATVNDMGTSDPVYVRRGFYIPPPASP